MLGMVFSSRHPLALYMHMLLRLLLSALYFLKYTVI